MKDNRDPALLGRQIRALVDDGAPILQAADVVEVYEAATGAAIPSYADTREPGEPMCGWPRDGRRNGTPRPEPEPGDPT